MVISNSHLRKSWRHKMNPTGEAHASESQPNENAPASQSGRGPSRRNASKQPDPAFVYQKNRYDPALVVAAILLLVVFFSSSKM